MFSSHMLVSLFLGSAPAIVRFILP